jgi:hypothetical protein
MGSSTDTIMIIDKLQKTGYVPRVHPNGFLQLDLNDEGTRRLHIWDLRLPRQDVRTSIHDHIFDMSSRVLVGILNQVRIIFTLEHWGHPTHEVYMAQYTERSSSQLMPTGVKVRRTTHRIESVQAGHTYGQTAFSFHDSEPATDVVATIMTKMKRYDGSPRVMVPVGLEPHNEFDRKAAADTDLLWTIVEETLGNHPWGI